MVIVGRCFVRVSAVTNDIEWHRRQIRLIDDLIVEARRGWPHAPRVNDVGILEETRDRLARSLQAHLDLRQPNAPAQVSLPATD